MKGAVTLLQKGTYRVSIRCLLCCFRGWDVLTFVRRFCYKRDEKLSSVGTCDRIQVDVGTRMNLEIHMNDSLSYEIFSPS